MKKYATLIVFCLLISATGKSQILHGKVLGENGNEVSFATITTADRSKTVSSDGHGRFEIILSKIPDTLIISAVGFQAYSAVVTDKAIKDPQFEVVLLLGERSLSEVIVTAYGTSKKKDISGAVSIVSGDALSATTAGLGVSTTGDSKGRVLRGTRPGYESEKTDDEVSHIDSRPLEMFDSATLASNKEQPVSRLLTAGELNDFNKWKMWEDFSKNDFNAYSEHWNLQATHRFCVQVLNNRFAALVGRKVYLVNSKTKDTVWAAVTDVTGKAELWSRLQVQDEQTGNYFIACQGSSVIVDHPSEFQDGVNKMILDAPCEMSNLVELSFVVDATGSMGDEIEYLKVELEDILRRTFAKFSDLDVNAASVFYRDQGDQYLTKYSDFNGDLLKTLNFIKLQSAGGGGDMPEAVNSALHTALDSLKWSEHARTKLLFIVLDAPPHDEARNEMYGIIQQAAAKGVRIIPIVCSDADKSTEFLMRTIALATNGTYVFLTDNSGIGNSHIKPTTDVYSVELLNNLLQRLIHQMVYVRACNDTTRTEPIIKMPANILQIKVAPNPTTGTVFVSSNKSFKEIYIADYSGKILMRLDAKQNKLQFSLRDYPNGTYLLKYITKDNQWGAEKIILIH